MSVRKICVVTGTRAEYGLFYPILKKIQDSNKLQLQLIATTAHLSSEFGLTYEQIEEEVFFIDDKSRTLGMRVNVTRKIVGLTNMYDITKFNTYFSD